MSELLLIVVSAILVNNFVLVQFLGLCPFMGVSKKVETAIGLSLATTFVLTLASICSYLVQQYILKPFDLEFLRTISFILVIAVVVQFTEMVVNKTSPMLYRVLGIFLPLITTNCIVLGVALLNANRGEYTFIQASVNGFAAGIGFSLVLVLFAAMRERIAIADVPKPMVERIDRLLPQTQCGQCGYPGCKPYAEAIAAGDKINKCPPGGEATIQALAELLDMEPEPLDAVEGEKPQMVAYIREAECIGCTKCIQACPVDAILGAAKQMHTVIVSECTGCDLCVEPCPVDCIDMIPVASTLQTWKWEQPLPAGTLIATDRESV